jgi:hypothetical protein
MASNISADIMATSSRTMDIRMASNSSIEVMAASAGLRMASNRSVEIMAASIGFRMGIRADSSMSFRVKTIQNTIPKAVISPSKT